MFRKMMFLKEDSDDDDTSTMNDEAAAAEETTMDSNPSPDADGWTVVPPKRRGLRANWV